jgi:hypothetical protein
MSGGITPEARAAMKAAAAVDGAHRDANPAQRQPGATVNLATTADPWNPGAEWAGLVRPIGGLVAMAVPEAAASYTGPAWDQACAEFGAALHAVAVKRGWQVDTLPEVALAFAAMQLATPAAAALYMRRQAQRDVAAQIAAAKTPPPPPAPEPPKAPK